MPENGESMVNVVTFTKEKRIEQLKACAQTIINNAEEMVGAFEFDISLDVVIHMECHAAPEIEVMRRITSREIIDSL